MTKKQLRIYWNIMTCFIWEIDTISFLKNYFTHSKIYGYYENIATGRFVEKSGFIYRVFKKVYSLFEERQKEH